VVVPLAGPQTLIITGVGDAIAGYLTP